MASSLTPPQAPHVETTASPTPQPLADASLLDDKVPGHMQLSRVVAGFTAAIGLFFVYISYFQPLWHTDLWGHLAYGRTIVAAKALPVTEPLMPLSAGVLFVDTAWLTQVIAFAAYDRLGFTAMSFANAAAIALMASLLLYRGYQRSRSAGVALLGVFLWSWGCWQHLTIVRPQLVGMTCFVMLLTLATSRHRRAWHWFAVPVLFCLWANTHGSFLLGLALLAGMAAGRSIDVVIRCGEFRAIQRDSHVRRLVLLMELAAAAVLLNPYGVRLYAEVLNIARNANLADLDEWAPLQLRMLQGQATAVISVVLIVLYRLSPRRVTSTEVLLLFGFGAAALWSSRMLVWWMPLAAYYGMMHASAIWHTRVMPLERMTPSPRNGRWSFVTAGLVFICFAGTPFGDRLLHGNKAKLKLEKYVSSETPLAVVEHLKKLSSENRLPRGQAFNTFEWGDYLLWDGPQELKVFVASHAHLVPSEVWKDYVSMIRGSSEWDGLLDRYGINLLLLSDVSHGGLIRRLKENEKWRLSYSDNTGAVFVRRKTI